MTLILKDENIKTSFVYGGYLILCQLKGKEKKRISFYEASEILTKGNIKQYGQQFFCLMFLYACDLIIFDEPHIELKKC
ncbi:MAG: hypothetical protein HRU36_00810 [Rickettsiales bacterium]|nr:hypothetical protein [Rickettsiales bacterium]